MIRGNQSIPQVLKYSMSAADLIMKLTVACCHAFQADLGVPRTGVLLEKGEKFGCKGFRTAFYDYADMKSLTPGYRCTFSPHLGRVYNQNHARVKHNLCGGNSSEEAMFNKILCVRPLLNNEQSTAACGSTASPVLIRITPTIIEPSTRFASCWATVPIH